MTGSAARSNMAAAATWLTGTYDPATDSLIWPIGNPCPDFNGDERKGDNLFTDFRRGARPENRHAQMALPIHAARSARLGRHRNADAGGHDIPGRAAKVASAGQPQRLFLCPRPDQRKVSRRESLCQETDLGEEDRRRTAARFWREGWQPTVEGTEICPSMDGASNWMSTAYHPGTGLFYLVALEKCNVFSKNAEWWKQGQSFYGGSARPVPAEDPAQISARHRSANGKDCVGI